MSVNDDSRYREVYSTSRGELCTKCSNPIKQCSCISSQRQAVLGNGDVRVRRETKGRAGKTVTTISGLALNKNELKLLLSHLKRISGAGGAEKDGIIELQGDHCELVMQQLSSQGIKAKRSGG